MLVLHVVSPAEYVDEMKTFGQVIVRARKAAGLTQKAVTEALRRGVIGMSRAINMQKGRERYLARHQGPTQIWDRKSLGNF